MPRVDESTLISIGVAIHVAGALCVLAFVVGLIRSGRWRNPLQALPAYEGGPLLVVPFLIYFGHELFRHLAVKPERFADPGSPDWYRALLIFGIIQLLFCGVSIAILAGRRPFTRHRRTAATVFWRGGLAIGGVLACFAITWVQLRFSQTLWQLANPDLEPPVHTTLEALEGGVGAWGVVLLTVSAVVLAPLYEELLFRGVLLQAAWSATGRAWPAVICTGLIFGLIHFPQPQAVLPLATFGIILGFLRLYTRSLSVCILVHALFNAKTMAFAILNPDLIRAGY